jgi:aminotransferase EvaB
MIKSWDYLNEYKLLKFKIDNTITKVLKSGTLFFGNENKKFEKNFTKINKSKYGLAVGSGTDALILSLKALNIGINDEVITVSNTAIPTAAAIKSVGATIKFVDVGTDFLIDVEKIENSITKKTKAIIPVHLYGQACEMKKILNLAKKYKLKVIEDCAQAQGAEHNKIKVGNFGHTGCYSFYPTKILGAYGDGGFIVTSNLKTYKRLKRLRFYGLEQSNKKKWWNNKYYSIETGFNSRLSEIQAGILNVKLNMLDRFINQRRFIANIYNNEIINKDIIKPCENLNNRHVYHLYVVSHKNRNMVLNKLKKQKILLGIQYPYPLHKMKAYKINDLKLKNCEIFSKKIFSLPIYPYLEKNSLKKIIKSLNSL